MRTWWHAVVDAEHELHEPDERGQDPACSASGSASGRTRTSSTSPRATAGRRSCSRRSSGAGSPASSARRSSSPPRGNASGGGLEDRIELVEADGATYELGRYDAALCIGATFVYGGLVPTLERLRPAAPLLAVGEPYWRTWPLPPEPELDAASGRRRGRLPLAETVERAESAGVRVVSLIASSEDDWDRYESLHWQTLDRWLAANPGHPQAEEFRARGAADRERYLRWERAVMGWAIFVCRT